MADDFDSEGRRVSAADLRPVLLASGEGCVYARHKGESRVGLFHRIGGGCSKDPAEVVFDSTGPARVTNTNWRRGYDAISWGKPGDKAN